MYETNRIHQSHFWTPEETLDYSMFKEFWNKRTPRARFKIFQNSGKELVEIIPSREYKESF